MAKSVGDSCLLEESVRRFVLLISRYAIPTAHALFDQVFLSAPSSLCHLPCVPSLHISTFLPLDGIIACEAQACCSLSQIIKTRFQRARSRDAIWFGQEDNLARSMRFAVGVEDAAGGVEVWQRRSVEEGLEEIGKVEGLRWGLTLERLIGAKKFLLKEILGE